VEILVIIVIVIVALVLAVAVGPLLAMRNPAEADKLTPGADPVHESRKEPDASESTSESPRPGTPRTSPSTRQGAGSEQP
jgi:NADH:ubiquinone oxidoreductase subunit 3 (subunit A)